MPPTRGHGSSPCRSAAVARRHSKAPSTMRGPGRRPVAAAGNDGADNSIDFPGAYDNAIAVGAIDANKARASYSDGGPQLDVMGPGTRCALDVQPEQHQLLAVVRDLDGDASRRRRFGAGAVLRAEHDQRRLARLLRRTAEDLGAAAATTSSGTASPVLTCSWHHSAAVAAVARRRRRLRRPHRARARAPRAPSRPIPIRERRPSRAARTPHSR